MPAELPAGSRADRHAHRGSSASTLHVVLNGGGCAVSLSWSALLVGIELLTRDTAGRPLITLLMRRLSSRNFVGELHLRVWITDRNLPSVAMVASQILQSACRL